MKDRLRPLGVRHGGGQRWVDVEREQSKLLLWLLPPSSQTSVFNAKANSAV